MLTREVFPGMFILVDEAAAWRELLLGVPAIVGEAPGTVTVEPGNNALCLVEDLSIRKGNSTSHTAVASF